MEPNEIAQMRKVKALTSPLERGDLVELTVSVGRANGRELRETFPCYFIAFHEQDRSLSYSTRKIDGEVASLSARYTRGESVWSIRDVSKI